MFDMSLLDPAELRGVDDGALVAAIEDCARVEAAVSARRRAAIAELVGRRTGDDERAHRLGSAAGHQTGARDRRLDRSL
ncbi:hypothetical protein [Mycobacterium lacus]|uniref:hypothetical protein n=1 Tax=Mycobacterium lacus TaxID=169765 RepID=UPI000A235845|nr:hypothetical protein [Mycobacterium lacus]ORW02659.1 hypothetical protein AWC15_06645 [Mycobacterium lacus]